jgi:1,4-dihydroxy-2-naphthoate octaprenyltransferase
MSGLTMNKGACIVIVTNTWIKEVTDIMPIIFENRLGNSESDKKLKKIYRLHNTLWTLYYAFFLAVVGFCIAILVSVQSNPIFGLLIAAITIGMLVLLFKRQAHQKRRE